MTHTSVPREVFFVIPLQTRTESAPTEARRPAAGAVLIRTNAEPMRKEGQKVFHSHIWQEYLDIVEQLRKTERGKEIYVQRKEPIERVFAYAKEKHAMRYTHHRGSATVTRWVKLKFAAMNLKSWQSGAGIAPF